MPFTLPTEPPVPVGTRGGGDACTARIAGTGLAAAAGCAGVTFVAPARTNAGLFVPGGGGGAPPLLLTPGGGGGGGGGPILFGAGRGDACTAVAALAVAVAGLTAAADCAGVTFAPPPARTNSGCGAGGGDIMYVKTWRGKI